MSGNDGNHGVHAGNGGHTPNEPSGSSRRANTNTPGLPPRSQEPEFRDTGDVFFYGCAYIRDLPQMNAEEFTLLPEMPVILVSHQGHGEDRFYSQCEAVAELFELTNAPVDKHGHATLDVDGRQKYIWQDMEPIPESYKLRASAEPDTQYGNGMGYVCNLRPPSGGLPEGIYKYRVTIVHAAGPVKTFDSHGFFVGYNQEVREDLLERSEVARVLMGREILEMVD